MVVIHESSSYSSWCWSINVEIIVFGNFRDINNQFLHTIIHLICFEGHFFIFFPLLNIFEYDLKLNHYSVQDDDLKLLI